MSATTEKVLELFGSRLTELDAEKARIENAIAALGDSPNGSTPAPARAPRLARGPGKRRKRRGGTRIDEAMSLIQESPGITASELAKAMKIKPNYLYRVIGQLERDRMVQKKGRQLFPGKVTLRG